MCHAFLNPFSKIVFTSIFLIVLSVEVSAQGSFSAGSAAVKKAPADTVKIVNSDGTVSYKIIEKKVTQSTVVAHDTILRENEDGTFDQIIIKKDGAFDCDDSKVYENVDLKPQFTGGQDALKKYIADNLKYPEYEARNKIEGRIIVQFTINKFGVVTDVQDVKTPARLKKLAKEAVRIVSKMPAWEPGKKNNLWVNTRYTLPIDFKLKK